MTLRCAERNHPPMPVGTHRMQLSPHAPLRIVILWFSTKKLVCRPISWCEHQKPISFIGYMQKVKKVLPPAGILMFLKRQFFVPR